MIAAFHYIEKETALFIIQENNGQREDDYRVRGGWMT
jgi:hypothetical protein